MERRGSTTQFFFLVHHRPDRCERHRTWSDPAAGRHSPGLHLVEPGNRALSSRLVCSAAGRDSPCEASLVRPHRLRAGQVPRSALSIAPVVPRWGAVGHGPAPGRRACTHRYAPPEIDRTAASPSTGACGRVPIGPFGAPVPTRSGDHRRAEEAVRSASPRGPPTTGGCGSSSSAVRDGVTQAQQVTTPRCTGVAELTGVELDGTPQSSSAGAGGLGACPGVRHRSQAMDVSIFDEKPDGLTPTTSGSGPMR
jgi:hypothetical protein